MLRTRQQLRNVIDSRSKFVFLRNASSNEAQWKEAKPFNQIPGPSTLGLIKGFLPGGLLLIWLTFTKLIWLVFREVPETEHYWAYKAPSARVWRPHQVPRHFRSKKYDFHFRSKRHRNSFQNWRKVPHSDWPWHSRILPWSSQERVVCKRHRIGSVVSFSEKSFVKSLTKFLLAKVRTGTTSELRVSMPSIEDKKEKPDILVNQTMLQPKTAKLYIPQIEEVVSELVAK